MLTDGDVAGAVRLKELVDVLPDLGQPLDDLDEVKVHAPGDHLDRHELPTQVAPEERPNRLDVVGVEDPAEVVVQLEVGGGAGRLVHRPNDVWRVVVVGVEEATKDVAERADMVEIVEDDDAGLEARHGLALTLSGHVGQVLAQLLARLTVHAKYGDGVWRHF